MSTGLEQIQTRYPVDRLEAALGRAVSRFEPEHRELLLSRIFHRPGERELYATEALVYCRRLITALRIPHRCEAWPVAGSHPDWGRNVQCEPVCIRCQEYDQCARELWHLMAEEIPEGPGWVQHCTEDGTLFRTNRDDAMTCSERCRKARSRRLTAAKAASRKGKPEVPDAPPPVLTSSR